jgi:hypothetical protein
LVRKGYSKEAATEIANKTVWSKSLFPSDLNLKDEDLAGYQAWKGGAADIGGKFAKMDAKFRGMRLDTKEIMNAKNPDIARDVIRRHQMEQSLLNDPFVTSGGIPGISVLKKIADMGGPIFDQVKELNRQILASKTSNPEEAHKKTVELATLLQNTGDQIIANAAGKIAGLDLSTVTRENVEQYKNAGISTFNADGKGKPGEYDIDVAEKDWNAGLEQMNKSMKEFIKIVKQKGK